MAVTHDNTTRNGIANYVVDQLDGGSLIFYASGGTTEVATLTFGTPAFGAATSGAAAATAITSDASATGGTTTIANFAKSGGTEIVECSVSTSGADINLSNNVINPGDSVTVGSLTYTAPA